MEKSEAKEGKLITDFFSSTLREDEQESVVKTHQLFVKASKKYHKTKHDTIRPEGSLGSSLRRTCKGQHVHLEIENARHVNKLFWEGMETCFNTRDEKKSVKQF